MTKLDLPEGPAREMAARTMKNMTLSVNQGQPQNVPVTIETHLTMEPAQ